MTSCGKDVKTPNSKTPSVTKTTSFPNTNTPAGEGQNNHTCGSQSGTYGSQSGTSGSSGGY